MQPLRHRQPGDDLDHAAAESPPCRQAAIVVVSMLAGRSAERAAGIGVLVADVALMSPVPGRGLRTPMVASGEGAASYAGVLAGFGIEVKILAGPAGAAISRKLLRSVFYKGVAAAVVEALEGAEAAGCAQWLREDISVELARFDEHTVERLVSGTHRHAERRAVEMAAAADQLKELGVEPRIAAATRDLLVDLTARRMRSAT